jgi:Sulfotransferase family
VATSTSTLTSRSARPKNATSKRPVFVIGCGRSGTTLLYHMIVSSGNFANYRIESNVLNLLEPRFRPLSSPRNKRRMLDAWYNSRLYTRSGLDPAQLEPVVMEKCQNGGDFLRIIMEQMCANQGVERWAETTPEHLLYLHRIKETIPDALIIHVIRDGRDVALSWEKLRQIRPLPWDRKRLAMAAGIHWEWIVARGREVGRTLGADYVEVHYEDVVRKPREVLAKLEPFISHDLNYERIQQVAIGSVAAPNTAFKEEYFNPIGRWKSAFTAEELATFESLVGNTLSELGYELGTSAVHRLRGPNLALMRSVYRSFFSTKHNLKAKTPAGRWFVTRDFSWI